MKIIVNADGVIWNEYLPVLGQFGRDVIVVKYASPDTFRPAHEEFTYLPADPRKTEMTGNAAKQKALEAAGGILLDCIGDDTDVLLLTDNDPVSFYPYEYLKKQFHTRRIHLLSCMPFSYESRRKKEEIREALSDLGMVRSLCLVELDSLLRSSDTQETMGRLQIRIRTFLQELLAYAIEQLPEMDEFYQYLFDPESGRYVETDLNGFIKSLEGGRTAAKGTMARGAMAQTGHKEIAGTELSDETGTDAGIGADRRADTGAGSASDMWLDDAEGDDEVPWEDAEAGSETGGEAEAESAESTGEDPAGESNRSAGKSPQPKEVEISFKRPVEKPSFLARLFGRKK